VGVLPYPFRGNSVCPFTTLLELVPQVRVVRHMNLPGQRITSHDAFPPLSKMEANEQANTSVQSIQIMFPQFRHLRSIQNPFCIDW
jgi:hypothetical protein